MKLTHLENAVENDENLIARFGGAALIKEPEGFYILAGGSRDDRLEAHEWISLFMHEVVVRDN